MNAPVIRKFTFSVLFPQRDQKREHVSRLKLHSLARRQMADLEIIETIDHLFRCHRCLENYRNVRKVYVRR